MGNGSNVYISLLDLGHTYYSIRAKLNEQVCLLLFHAVMSQRISIIPISILITYILRIKHKLSLIHRQNLVTK